MQPVRSNDSGRRYLAMIAAWIGLCAAAQAQSAQPQRPWTLLIYGAADNNADGPIQEFLDGVRKALDDDPGMELLVFIDRSENYSNESALFGENFTGARLYRLTKDSAQRLAGGAAFPEIKIDQEVELDSADATNIGKFIAWGKANYPAERTGLMIYSHANGETMCPDEHARRDMGIAELTQDVGAEGCVDFLALELCNMAGIEVAYQWRKGNGRFSAGVLVAIPNAGPPLDWERAFARIRTPGHETPASRRPFDPAAMTAADFGKLVIEEGHEGRMAASASRPRVMHESAGCFDLGKVVPVKRAVDEMSQALSKVDARDAFFELRNSRAASAMINYSEAGPYVDLYELCKRTAAGANFPSAARKAAEVAMAAIDEFIVASFGMDGYVGFEPGRHGVFIVLPAEPSRWKRFRWYTPLPGEGDICGAWAFLGDGATADNGIVENWFELLDAWMDEPDASGGINRYKP